MLKIFFISISLFLTSTPSISADEIGSFWRAKKTTVDNKKAKVGDVFKINQLISTGKSSRSKAEITTVDNSRYILYKNSSIKFEELDLSGSVCNGMKVTLTQGKIRGTSGSCGHGKTEIKTAVAAAFACGTDYEMMFLPEGKKIPGYENIEPGFYQKVNEGKVMVSNDNGSLLIHPGEAGFVSVSGVPPIIIPLPDFFTNTKKPAPKPKKKSTTKEKTDKTQKKSTTKEKTDKNQKKSTTKEKTDKTQKKSTTKEKTAKTQKKATQPNTEAEKSDKKPKVTSKSEAPVKVQDQSSNSEDTTTEQPVDDDIGEDVESEIIETTPDNDIDSGEALMVEKVIDDDSNDITINPTVTPEITIQQKDNKGGVTTEIKIISSSTQPSTPIITPLPNAQTQTTTETYNVDIYDDGSTKKTLLYTTKETTTEQLTYPYSTDTADQRTEQSDDKLSPTPSIDPGLPQENPENSQKTTQIDNYHFYYRDSVYTKELKFRQKFVTTNVTYPNGSSTDSGPEPISEPTLVPEYEKEVFLRYDQRKELDYTTITVRETIPDNDNAWIPQGEEYKGDNVIGSTTSGTPTTTNHITQTYHFQTVEIWQNQKKYATTTTTVNKYQPNDTTYSNPIPLIGDRPATIPTATQDILLRNDKDINNVVYVLLEGYEDDLKNNLDIYGVDQKISGENASLFEVDPATGDGTNDKIRLISSNIYDDLFDPILNQSTPVEIEIDITSENQITHSPKTTKYKFKPTDTRNATSSYVAARKYERWRRSTFTPLTIQNELTRHNNNQVKSSTPLNQRGSNVIIGSYQDPITPLTTTSYIWEDQRDNGTANGDGSYSINLPKSGILKYDLMNASYVVINDEIDYDYELTQAFAEINFQKDRDNLTSQIEITHTKSDGTKTPFLSNKATTTLINFSNRQGKYAHNSFDSNLYNLPIKKPFAITGSMMGNNGSHIGMAYTTKINDTDIASGTALLKAVSRTDRQVNGNLILLRSNQDAIYDVTDMVATTPYTSYFITGLSSDPFKTTKDGIDEINHQYVSDTLDENGDTKTLFYCASGENCYSWTEAAIPGEERQTKKIIRSDYSGNFEDSIKINTGTESESTIHWGWWQNPYEAKYHIDGDGPLEEVNNSGTSPLDVNSMSSLFLYEDFAELPDTDGGMHLPTSGTIDYEILDNSELIINATKGDAVSDEYYLSSASLDINFTNNNLNTTIGIGSQSEGNNFLTASGSDSLNHNTGRFSVSGGESGTAKIRQYFGFRDRTLDLSGSSGQLLVNSNQYSYKEIKKGEFVAVGAMMGVNGSHVGMGFKMAIKDIDPVDLAEQTFDNTVSGVILFKAK